MTGPEGGAQPDPAHGGRTGSAHRAAGTQELPGSLQSSRETQCSSKLKLVQHLLPIPGLLPHRDLRGAEEKSLA